MTHLLPVRALHSDIALPSRSVPDPALHPQSGRFGRRPRQVHAELICVPIELGADELADRRSPSAWRWFINVGHRHPRAVAHGAQPERVGDPRIGDVNLVELSKTGELPQRAGLASVGVHVGERSRSGRDAWARSGRYGPGATPTVTGAPGSSTPSARQSAGHAEPAEPFGHPVGIGSARRSTVERGESADGQLRGLGRTISLQSARGASHLTCGDGEEGIGATEHQLTQ